MTTLARPQRRPDRRRDRPHDDARRSGSARPWPPSASRFTWMGTRKTLTPEQTAQAAETFDAEGQFLSAAKKLLDTKHPAFRAVTAVRGKIESYWQGVSLPFPEPGVRLDPAGPRRGVRPPDGRLPGRARRRRRQPRPPLRRAQGGGRRTPRVALLRGDYPDSLTGLFAVAWEFPNVEPPDYLLELNAGPLRRRSGPASPPGSRRPCSWPSRRSSTSSASSSPTSASGSPAPATEGGPKVFRDSAVDNLAEFFDRFRTLNVRSNDQLDALVAEAQRAVRGVDPQQLRDSEALRRRVASRLTDVRSALDGLLVDRPRRRILRPAAAAGGA